VESIYVEENADRSALIVEDDKLAVVRCAHCRKGGAQRNVLGNRRGREHEGGSGL
jgi:hypothetical protein